MSEFLLLNESLTEPREIAMRGKKKKVTRTNLKISLKLLIRTNEDSSDSLQAREDLQSPWGLVALSLWIPTSLGRYQGD